VSTRPDSQHIRLVGVFRGDSIDILGRQMNESDYLLTSHGFHWIQEIPFNR
jgi:hypothetical protein